MVPRREAARQGPDFNQIVGSLIVAGILALIGLIWNINTRVTNIEATAGYNKVLLCQMAKQQSLPAWACPQ